MSTRQAFVKVVYEITKSLNRRKHSIGAITDLLKVFDTVHHKRISNKLDFYCIRRVAYQPMVRTMDISLSVYL